jgi:heme-degrading monooxygenase HmoA
MQPFPAGEPDVIAVIFEVLPKPGQAQRYFDIAAELKPMLGGIDGFISVERFESLSQPGRYLSLSYWRDEDAVRAWRTHALHRAGQREGRAVVFDDYRIRVAAVLRDYGLRERAQAPADSLNYFL